MVAVVSGRATSQKSESCEEYRCYDFRNCPVCHLLAYAYFVLILQSKIGRNRGSKIVLIDGSRLAELMIEFSVAVATDTTKDAFHSDLQILLAQGNFTLPFWASGKGDKGHPLDAKMLIIGTILLPRLFHRIYIGTEKRDSIWGISTAAFQGKPYQKKHL
jgi:hypothetical protein